MTDKIYDQREDLYAVQKAAERFHYTPQERAAVRADRCPECTGGCKIAQPDPGYLCARKAWPEDFR